MGMDLANKAGDYYRIGQGGWDRALTLAKSYGWEPAGTLKPSHWGKDIDDMFTPDGPWAGAYDTNDEQEVTAEDAAALADALERSLPDLPDIAEAPEWFVDARALNNPVGYAAWYAKTFADEPDMGLMVPNTDLSPIEFFSGAEKPKITGFIAFCRKGSFTIG